MHFCMYALHDFGVLNTGMMAGCGFSSGIVTGGAGASAFVDNLHD